MPATKAVIVLHQAPFKLHPAAKTATTRVKIRRANRLQISPIETTTLTLTPKGGVTVCG